MDVRSITGKVRAHSEDIKRLNWLTGLVILVFFSIFITMFQQSLANKQATYQNLVNQVNEQNTQIQVLTNEINQLRLEQIQAHAPKLPQQPQ